MASRIVLGLSADHTRLLQNNNPSKVLQASLPVLAGEERDNKSLAARRIHDENNPTDTFQAINKCLKHHWKSAFKNRIGFVDYQINKRIFLEWLDHKASYEAAIKLYKLDNNNTDITSEIELKIAALRSEVAGKAFVETLFEQATKADDAEFLKMVLDLPQFKELVFKPFSKGYEVELPLSFALKQNREAVYALFLGKIKEWNYPEQAFICAHSTIFVMLLEKEVHVKNLESAIIALVEYLPIEVLAKIVNHTERPKDRHFMPCYSLICHLMGHGHFYALEAIRQAVPITFKKSVQTNDYVNLGGVCAKRHAKGDHCCELIIKAGGVIRHPLRTLRELDRLKYCDAKRALERRKDFISMLLHELLTAEKPDLYIEELLKCSFSKEHFIGDFLEHVLQVVSNDPQLLTKKAIAALSNYVAKLQLQGYVYAIDKRTLSIVQRFVFRLNLETAIQGDKVMQDFESGSFAMGVDHSQKVKATPIANDYGSKDCVNLSPSIAVSRLNEGLKIPDELAFDLVVLFTSLNLRHEKIWQTVLYLPGQLRVAYVKFLAEQRVNPNSDLAYKVIRKLVWQGDFETVKAIFVHPDFKDNFSTLFIKAFYLSNEPEKALAELEERMKQDSFRKEFSPRLVDMWSVMLGNLREDQSKIAFGFIGSLFKMRFNRQEGELGDFELLLRFMSDYQLPPGSTKLQMCLAWNFILQYPNAQAIVQDIHVDKSVLFGIRQLLSIIQKNHMRPTAFKTMATILEAALATRHCLNQLEQISFDGKLRGKKINFEQFIDKEIIRFCYLFLYENTQNIPRVRQLNQGLFTCNVLYIMMNELNNYFLLHGDRLPSARLNSTIRVLHELRVLFYYSPDFNNYSRLSRLVSRVRHTILNMNVMPPERAPRDLLLYGGTATHSVVNVVSKLDNNNFRFTCFNTGEGCERSEDDSGLVVAKTFFDLTCDDLSNKFLFRLFKLAHEKCDYEEVHKLHDASFNDDSYTQATDEFPEQELGSCALMSLLRTLETRLGSTHYKPFYLFIVNNINSRVEYILKNPNLINFEMCLVFGTTKPSDVLFYLQSWQRAVKEINKR